MHSPITAKTPYTQRKHPKIYKFPLGIETFLLYIQRIPESLGRIRCRIILLFPAKERQHFPQKKVTSSRNNQLT